MAVPVTGSDDIERARAEWQAVLDEDERLLWIGEPVQAFRFAQGSIGLSIVGIFFLGFALLWTGMAASPLFSGQMPSGSWSWLFIFFPLFGLPFIAAGAWMVFGQHIWRARQMRQTRYALTDRRAIITNWSGKRSLKSYPIGPDTIIDYQPGNEANLFFATEVETDSDGDKSVERIGFEHFTDGDAAYAVIRKIQNGTA